jgi:hypothetical protein
MLVGSMVGFVENNEANVTAQINVAMPEGVEEDIVSGDNDAVIGYNTTPKVDIFPLVGFVGSRDNADIDWNAVDNHSMLLVRKSYGRRHKPANLERL